MSTWDGMPELETPAFIYDLGEVRAAYRALTGVLPSPSRLCYSLKANPHPDVLATLCAEGAAAEVSSRGETEAALAAGFAADEIVYTGPGKRDGDIEFALRHGVTLFSTDSAAGLDQLARLAAATGVPARTLLRVNGEATGAGRGLTMGGGASKFGADIEWIRAEPERFRSREHLDVCGVHVYQGSNVESDEGLFAQLADAVAVGAEVERLLETEVSVLDLGGGFPAPFARPGKLAGMQSIRGSIEPLLDAAFPRWRAGSPEVLFESGRYLTASCGSLRTRVLDVKVSRDRNIVVLDAGVNHLGGMSGLRRVPEPAPDFEPCGEDDLLEDAMVGGPLCTPLDTWCRRKDFPKVDIGDVVTIPNVGAYGLYASLVTFLGHPFPLEVAVEDGEVVGMTQLRTVREHVGAGVPA